MNWRKFMDEKDYQRFLVKCLTERTDGPAPFRLRTNADYCRLYALDKGLLVEFLESTQPDKMRELSRVHKSKRDEVIAQAVNLSCVSQGGSLIETLKQGVSVGPTHLDLFNPPPDSSNEKSVAAAWKKNVFSVAREVWASFRRRNQAYAVLALVEQWDKRLEILNGRFASCCHDRIRDRQAFPVPRREGDYAPAITPPLCLCCCIKPRKYTTLKCGDIIP